MLVVTYPLTLLFIGRRGGIRTRDPLHPMQVRYQAALHAEERRNYSALGPCLEEQITDLRELLAQDTHAFIARLKYQNTLTRF